MHLLSVAHGDMNTIESIKLRRSNEPSEGFKTRKNSF